MMPKTMTKTHEFTLILAGRPDMTESVGDAVYEAGGDDASLGTCSGVSYVDFDREAETLYDAISSAIAVVESAGLTVERIEPDEIVTTAEIGKRLGRSREDVRLLASGKRGPGGFPDPISGIKKRAPHDRWSDVAIWARETLGIALSENADEARTIGALNAALQLRRYAREPKEAERVLREITRSRR
jgi:hypothetical protein